MAYKGLEEGSKEIDKAISDFLKIKDELKEEVDKLQEYVDRRKNHGNIFLRQK